MSALYTMTYQGVGGLGIGAVYVGKGTIVGADAGNGRYQGSYTEEGGRLKGRVTLSVPAGATLLVTGQTLQSGQNLELNLDWPLDFANGQPQQVTVGGRPVHVVFEKVGDIP